MVQWTYENAKRCRLLNKIIVATDDEAIATVIQRIGGEVQMTDPTIATGSDRVACVAKEHPEADIIINLQGDEPFIRPAMLEQLVAPFFGDNPPCMSTLAYPLAADKYTSAGSVKVITDLNGDALYFSRAPIPYYRTLEANVPVFNHMGLYAFRRDFLLTYCTLAQTPLEKTEALEQLRALEHGFKIRVCLTEQKTLEINTPEEYELAQTFEYSI